MNIKSELKNLKWQDLTKMSLKGKFVENTLTLPWLVFSWIFAYNEVYYLAIPCSAFFFLTTLRQVHSGFHNLLGLKKKTTLINSFVNSVLMISSIQAIKFNHLRHHKYNLQEDDYEGKAAKLSWYGALVYGPVHVFKIHFTPFSLHAKRYQKFVTLKIIAIF